MRGLRRRSNASSAPLLLLSLFLVGIAAPLSAQLHHYQGSEDEGGSSVAKGFREGMEYHFQYDSQMAVGLSGASKPTRVEGQSAKAVTRFQCQVKFEFGGDEQATLRIVKPHIGQLNAPLPSSDAQHIQPMAVFEKSTLDTVELRQLLLPVRFQYSAEGVVKSVQFSAEDSTFSKNVKRAILNLIQRNLAPLKSKAKSSGSAQMSDDEKLYLTKAYAVPEVTLEGDCQTLYSINGNDGLRLRRSKSHLKSAIYNVTKSVDFKRCRRIADVGFGLAVGNVETSAHCLKCAQQHWQKLRHSSDAEGAFFYENACADHCDPKEVDEKLVQRSTVMRYVCAGRPESGDCELKRAELLSQYIFRNLHDISALSSSSRPSSVGGQLAATVVAKLELVAERPLSVASRSYGGKTTDAGASMNIVDTLMYDNDFAQRQKRFFMYGDADFLDEKLPFSDVKYKTEQAIQAVHQLIQATSDAASRIETNRLVVNMPRLIEILRMASAEELKHIVAESIAQATSDKSEEDVYKTRELLADALATAGTKNTVDALVTMIETYEIPIIKAVHSVTILGSLPASSTQIVKMILKLGSGELARREPALKQACQLTAGALIGEVCHLRAKSDAQAYIYGRQTGFKLNISRSTGGAYEQMKQHDKDENVDEEQEQKEWLNVVCSSADEKFYAKVLIDELKHAETLHEKILALKAIGNAGLSATVERLAAIIRRDARRSDNSNFSAEETTLLRVHAIDALRRLSALASCKLQAILLPIYEDANERVEVRMAALAAMMLTRPKTALIDQMIYAISAERSRDVKAFTYTTLKNYAKLRMEAQPKYAQHINNALQTLESNDVEDANTTPSTNWEMNASDGVPNVILSVMSIIDAKKAEWLHIPTTASLSLYGVYDDVAEKLNNFVGVSMSQMNLSKWGKNIMKTLLNALNNTNDSDKSSRLSGDAYGAHESERQMREIIEQLGISKRRKMSSSTASVSGDVPPFVALTIRAKNIDKALISLNERTLLLALQALVKGEQMPQKAMDDDVKFNRKLYSMMDADEYAAVIPTTMGIPLRIHNSNPIFSYFASQGSLSGGILKFDLRPSLSAYRVGKLEAIWPEQMVVGVESVRALEVNLPLSGQLTADIKTNSIEVALQTPTEKVRVFGIHTLAATFTKDFDASAQRFVNTKLRSISVPQLSVHQSEIDEMIAKHTMGLPTRLTGHVHLPPKRADQSVYDYLAELARVSAASENHIHLTFEPDEDTSRELLIRLSGNVFEKISRAQVHSAHGDTTTLRDFYASRSNRLLESRDKNSRKSAENFDAENEKLNNFLTRIGKPYIKMYKHRAKLSVQCSGGRKQVKADVQLAAICDASFKYCKLAGDIKRTPVYASETNWWAFKTRADIALPETLSSIEELATLTDTKSQTLAMNAKFEWGDAAAIAQASNNAQKQFIDLRLHGESKTEKALKRRLASISDENDDAEEVQKIRREMAFLNSYDLDAEYKMSAYAQNVFVRAFELLKAKNFWNVKTRVPPSTTERTNLLATTTAQCLPTSHESACRMRATLEIEPITQRYANISVQTPAQDVLINALALPYRVRYFALVSAADASTHSSHQLLKRYVDARHDNTRAKCIVSGRAADASVRTFDGAMFNAPLTKCYTVLAKDCATQKFSVLMKSADDDGMNKKIKIITPKSIVECAKKEGSSNKNIECIKNGKAIAAEDQLQYDSESGVTIEYNNGEQTLVEIRDSTIDGLSVKFACVCANCACQRATIALDEKYKGAQCGICGHYDDDEDAWRANNRNAKESTTNETEIQELFKSYTLHDSKECPKALRDQQIDENIKKISKSLRKNYVNANEARLYGGYDWNIENENKKDEESLFVWKSFSGRKDADAEEQAKSMKNENKESNFIYEDPELRTRVMEYNQRICFSIETIKECAEGTTPKRAADLRIDAADLDESAMIDDENPQQNDAEDEIVTVSFACLARSASEARRMQKQARRGVALSEITKYEPNYVQKIVLPYKCLKYTEV